MSLVAWLVLGLVAGTLAKLVTRESPGGGCLTGLIVSIVLGIAGAVIGGWIGTQLGWGEVDEFDLRSLGLAFLGAVLILLLLGAIRRR
jgi:uncharacterized membrane protein YeaQ/YmgE (transglycosylase-associated protein family)